MAQNYCGKCGNAVQPKDLYCVRCGSPLGSKNVIAEHTESAMPVQKKSAQSTPPVSPNQQQVVNHEQQLPKPRSVMKVATPQERHAKEQADMDQKIISGCGVAGAVLFLILNFTTGIVPGGFIGGAIGGSLGAIVGIVIISLRRKKS